MEDSTQNATVWIVISALLLILCLVEGYFVYKERNEKIALSMQMVASQQAMKPSNTSRRAPSVVMKGQTFIDNPLYKKAYLIFPVSGTLSADAQKSLTGWTVNTTPNADGSTQVDLIPKEAEDVKQSFTVKPGYKLYFIEMTLVDDQTGVDENRGDDLGVLVDQNGVVQ